MLEEFRTQDIIWDKANRSIFEPVQASEGDEHGRRLKVQIINGGVIENLSGTNLYLAWQTSNKSNSGLEPFDVLDASQGTFELYYPTGMLKHSGKLRGGLVLTDANGRLMSREFTIQVDRSVVDDEAVESSNEFSALTQALVKINDLEANYTPRLNEVTAQLAQKVSKQDLDTLIAGIPGGTPGFVSSINEMTDTSKLYVLKSNGHVYYYHNGEWTDTDHVYQAQDIDKRSVKSRHITDQLVNAISFYDSIAETDWSYGTINTSTGAVTVGGTDYQAITPDLIVADRDIVIANNYPETYEFWVHYYDETGENFVRNEPWLRTNKHVVEKGQYFRLRYRPIGSSRIPNTVDLSDQFILLKKPILEETVEEEKEVDITNNLVNTLTDYSKVITLEWENGVINPYQSGELEPGEVNLGSDYGRITADLITANEDMLLVNNEPDAQELWIFFYDESGNTLTSDEGWMSYSKYEIKRGQHFRLRYRPVGGGRIPADVDPNDYFVLLEKPDKIKWPLDKIPRYWEEEIQNKIDYINALQREDGANRYSFVVVTDTHHQKGEHTNSSLLIKRILEKCNIKHLLHLGDFIVDRGNKEDSMDNLLYSVGRYRNLGGLFLPVIGNHDDAVYSGSLAQTIVKGEQYSEIFRHLRNEVVYGDTGTYYYHDDLFHKTRYIFLDALDMPYVDNSGDGAADLVRLGYAQTQVDWLANNALNVPSDDWNVIVASHAPPYTEPDVNRGGAIPMNSDIVMNIIEAFKNAEPFTATKVYPSHETYYDLDVDYDFSNQTGEVVATLFGHIHDDHLLYWNDNIPVLVTINEGSNQRPGALPKVPNTTDELAFEVITVDKSNRKGYVTRIGLGENREFTY